MLSRYYLPHAAAVLFGPSLLTKEDFRTKGRPGKRGAKKPPKRRDDEREGKRFKIKGIRP